jgi:hypothetical protein
MQFGLATAMQPSLSLHGPSGCNRNTLRFTPASDRGRENYPFFSLAILKTITPLLRYHQSWQNRSLNNQKKTPMPATCSFTLLLRKSHRPKTRKLALAGAAVLLTLPVYLALGNFRPLQDLFVYHDAWKAFTPLFLLGNTTGIQDDGAVVETTMFVISFFIAPVIAHLIARCIAPAGVKS